jgi:hypothetical protein
MMAHPEWFVADRQAKYVAPDVVDVMEYRREERELFQHLDNIKLVWDRSQGLSAEDREHLAKRWEVAFSDLWSVAVRRFKEFLPTTLPSYPKGFHLEVEKEEREIRERMHDNALQWENATPKDQYARDLLVNYWYLDYGRLGEIGLHKYRSEPLEWSGPKSQEVIARGRARNAMLQAIRAVNAKNRVKMRKHKGRTQRPSSWTPWQTVENPWAGVPEYPMWTQWRNVEDTTDL